MRLPTVLKHTTADDRPANTHSVLALTTHYALPTTYYSLPTVRVMKIAVCIKQVPTREWQPRLNEARTWIRESDASYEMNEPDAYALEEGLRLRGKQDDLGDKSEVVVCAAGPARVATVIREA